MSKMRSVWFFVFVLISIQKALGYDCFKGSGPSSCDECIRCGRQWCNTQGSSHCPISDEDDWCPFEQELLVSIPNVKRNSDLVSPIYAEMSLQVDAPNIFEIDYTARSKEKANISIKNSTQNFDIMVREENVVCKGLKCKTTIEATPRTSFCSQSGGAHEYVLVEIGVGGLDEKVTLKYHIPCACECTQNVITNALQCKKNGNFSCGVCTCNQGWSGVDCSEPVCDTLRGDTQCGSKNDLPCSGNGYCSPCDVCICDTDREGSQYFDKDNDCQDLCMVVNYCDTCLVNETMGRCNECLNSELFVQKYDEHLLEERDQLNRKVWVKCNETVGECFVSYVAKKDEQNVVTVMVVESCNTIIKDKHIGGSNVSILAAVLGILAVVAAVGGAFYWHYMNAAPLGAPLNVPGYQNIEAQESVGQNPLYRSPNSHFPNPMYGNKS